MIVIRLLGAGPQMEGDGPGAPHLIVAYRDNRCDAAITAQLHKFVVKILVGRRPSLAIIILERSIHIEYGLLSRFEGTILVFSARGKLHRKSFQRSDTNGPYY